MLPMSVAILTVGLGVSSDTSRLVLTTTPKSVPSTVAWVLLAVMVSVAVPASAKSPA